MWPGPLCKKRVDTRTFGGYIPNGRMRRTMKRIAFVIVIGVGLSIALVSGAAAFPHGGWHGGPYWGWYGPGPWGGYPYGYPYYGYAYPYYYPSPSYDSTVPAPSAPQQAYWYYCKDANAYYPYVQSCPGGWTQVAPVQPPAGSGPPPQAGDQRGTQ